MSEYYVLSTTGQKFGPADVARLNQWASEGRVTSEMTVEAVNTGEQFAVTAVPGFTVAPPSLYASPTQYGSTPSFPSNYVRVENYLVKAILSTVFCFVPAGIVAIVYATQVDGHARRGDYIAAQDSANKANIWSNWAIGIPVVMFAVYLIFVVAVVGLSAATGHH